MEPGSLTCVLPALYRGPSGSPCSRQQPCQVTGALWPPAILFTAVADILQFPVTLAAATCAICPDFQLSGLEKLSATHLQRHGIPCNMSPPQRLHCSVLAAHLQWQMLQLQRASARPWPQLPTTSPHWACLSGWCIGVTQATWQSSCLQWAAMAQPTLGGRFVCPMMG
jgi:hypothetical protein